MPLALSGNYFSRHCDTNKAPYYYICRIRGFICNSHELESKNMSKRMKNILFGVCLWALCLFSCGKKAEYHSTEEMFGGLPRYALENGQKLPIDMVGAFAIRFVVAGDYVITNHSTGWGGIDYCIGIYNRHTGELTKAAFTGNGPDEYNIVTGEDRLNDSVFYISTGNGRNHVALYNLNHLHDEPVFRPFDYINRSKISEMEKETYGRFEGGLAFPALLTLDTTLVARAYESTCTKMFGVYKRGKGLPKYFIDYPASSNKDKENQFHPMAKFSMYQSHVAINDDGNKVFNAFSTADIIHFYSLKDGQLEPFKKYEYSMTSYLTDGNSYGLSSNKSLTYYRRVRWHDGRVYVLSVGERTPTEYRTLEAEQANRLEQGKPEKIYLKLLVFSEDGDPLHTLYLDTNPMDIRFSGDKLYALHVNALGDSEILEYDLSDMKPLSESAIRLAE